MGLRMGEAVDILSFFHEATSTASHIVIDPTSGEAAIIDPVLDYEPANGRTATAFTDTMLAALAQTKGRLRWVLETHPHADHLSSAQYLRDKTGARVAIGAEVTHIQAFFKPKFNAADLVADGSDFDLLLREGDRIPLGAQSIAAMHTPGHTRSCMTYRIADAAFVGDTVFMPDYGTARTDFPTGDAVTLYHSIARIHELPDATRLFLCHDYRGPGRTHTEWMTNVADSKRNVHLRECSDAASFAKFREAKNKTLGPPRLLAASVQVNIRAGKMPPPDGDGRTYLRIPVNGL
jgi:glyoxylase-like metal-dependent hydrolase (beta-lactamase superfamily II)